MMKHRWLLSQRERLLLRLGSWSASAASIAMRKTNGEVAAHNETTESTPAMKGGHSIKKFRELAAAAAAAQRTKPLTPAID